ncbi:3-hydroxybutyrate dehydrogenase [Amphibiibacter pelophylacis]|uniref:3-hydroxybutyrate dehydrogenase n=1 Tax=Amphibiibacter pelophylacis TaxID=1799477 RepID=A0ACC6P0V6_9BURK
MTANNLHTLSLDGRSALITGAASGIGLAMAQAFAGAGAKVCIADLDADKAEAAAETLRAAGHNAIAVAMDVASEEQVDAGFAKTVEAFGSVDVAVSNAGIQVISPIVDLSLAQWKKMMGIHLDGAFLTTRAAMRAMKASGRGGAIIYTGSVHSHLASVLKAPYVTAKHGLLGLARVVAKEGAEFGIRSNVICPGFVRTPLVDKQIPEQAKNLGITEEEVIKTVMLKDTVDGEFTSLDDVAQTALFLAAMRTNALTGQSVTVSHGWFMH